MKKFGTIAAFGLVCCGFIAGCASTESESSTDVTAAEAETSACCAEKEAAGENACCKEMGAEACAEKAAECSAHEKKDQ